MRTTTSNKLKDVNNLNDYLNFLQSNYQTLICKPGALLKTMLIYTIVSKIGKNAVITDTIKNKCLETNNIDEFINVIKANFDTTKEFSEQAKNGLESDTNKLTIIVGLQENEPPPPPKEEKKIEVKAEAKKKPRK